jgi:hypothetical protein
MRAITLAVSIFAVALVLRAALYFDGNYDNGEIVGGEAVGRVASSCTPAAHDCDLGPNGLTLCLEAIRDRCVTPSDLLIDRLFPGGPPSPVARITGHEEPPTMLPWQEPPTYLAGHWITVVALEDGTRVLDIGSGGGQFLELRDIRR